MCTFVCSLKVLLADTGEEVDLIGGGDCPSAPKLPPPPSASNPLSSSSAGQPAAAAKDPFDLLGESTFLIRMNQPLSLSSVGQPQAAVAKDPFDLLGKKN